MTRPCEACGAQPPMIAEGPWRGQRHAHDYCAACSMDLCDGCLTNGRCRETIDRKHVIHGPKAQSAPAARTPATRDQLIARAERTIAGCLSDVDQLDIVHERVLTDPTAILFYVYTTRERAYRLAGEIARFLTDEHLTPWTRVWPTADGCHVAIRVPVGAP